MIYLQSSSYNLYDCMMPGLTPMLYTNSCTDVLTGVYSHLIDEFKSHCAQEVINHSRRVILSDPASV